MTWGDNRGAEVDAKGIEAPRTPAKNECDLL